MTKTKPFFTPRDLPRDDRPLHKRVADVLREAIQTGRLMPDGDIELPSSRLLAGQLGISMNTITDSMRILRGEGLVIGGIGRLYRVPDRPPIRVVSSGRYRQAIAALREGREPETSICVDYGVPFEAYTVNATYVHTIAGERIAELTGWSPDLPVVRRTMVEHIERMPVQITVSVIPVHLADGTTLDDPGAQPVRGGILAELASINQLPTERQELRLVRQPSGSEAHSLAIDDSAPVYETHRVWYAPDLGADGVVTAVEYSETVVGCHMVQYVDREEL